MFTFPTTLFSSSGPVWITAAGTLGSFNGGSAVSATVNATGAGITYAVTSGALPPGTSLASSTGVISGTASQPSSTTTFNFSITATDLSNNHAVRAFSLLIRHVVPPVWTTSAGSLGVVFIGSNVSIPLVATAG